MGVAPRTHCIDAGENSGASADRQPDVGVGQGAYMITPRMSTADRHLLIRAKYEEKVFMDAVASEEMLEQGPGSHPAARCNLWDHDHARDGARTHYH